jgi:serine/threonine-protein kinase ULK4
VQVAAVNILNQALSQPEVAPKLAGLLNQEQGLLPAAMGLLDHSLPLLRAKAVISTVLLCRCVRNMEGGAGNAALTDAAVLVF